MRSLWLVMFLALAACGPATPPASAPSALLGAPLPPLSGRTVEGRALLPEQLADKIVVVKFFAKYCKPCKKTLPAAQRLHRERDDVLVVGVAEDDTSADVLELIERFGLTFPVIHDPANVVAGEFGVEQLPATFVTDAAGKVRWVGSPGQSESDLEAAVGWIRGGAKL